MAGETPVRVDQEAHELLKEQAESSGRTLRDLASEAIKVHTGRDLRDEVSQQVDRLGTLCDELEAQVRSVKELASVPAELNEVRERLEDVEEGLEARNETYSRRLDRLGQLVGALEEAFRRAIDRLRGES